MTREPQDLRKTLQKVSVNLTLRRSQRNILSHPPIRRRPNFGDWLIASPANVV
jgi:hypothetical protein